MTEEQARREIDSRAAASEKILNDSDAADRFLQQLEKKLKLIPVAGNALADVAVLAALVKSYLQGEYKNLPLGSIIAIIGALLYFLSTIDLIPDVLPAIGLADDAAVIACCLTLVNSDVTEYKRWREAHSKTSFIV